jgi:D-arabinose 1-dehydrogenase-like Zn-dependent alcohol dehydrogenase
MAKMRAVQIARAGAGLEMVEREIPEPGPGRVRVKVEACGVCHSDTIVAAGSLPGQGYPRIPGHEVIGVIDAVGPQVPRWKVGQRVGVGWNGGYCGYCDNCRRGNFFACQTENPVTGITEDGGYAEYVVARFSGLAAVPEGMVAAEAAPLMCAGVTTFNALRNSGARPGDLVAVLGVGGLGHLGVQYAAKMGFRTVAIARGADKEQFARKLGASHYIDNQAQDPAAELQKLGGASIVLATVTEGKAMTATLAGLGPRGSLMVLGVPPSMEVAPLPLVFGARAVRGWYSGTSIDSQDTLAFSAQAGVRSMNEVFPLEKASEAYERMASGKVRFRAVLTMGE